MAGDELLKLRDAAEAAQVDENILIKKLKAARIPLLFKPDSFLYLYCLSIDKSKIPPFNPFKGLLQDGRTNYQEVSKPDYIVIDSIEYENISNEKTIKFDYFYKIANFNSSQFIMTVSARDFITSTSSNGTKQKNITICAAFAFFKNKNLEPPLFIKNHTFNPPPTEPCETKITIDQLLVTKKDLITLFPSIPDLEPITKNEERLRDEKAIKNAREAKIEEQKLRSTKVTKVWMSENLKIINLACLELHTKRKNVENISTDKLKKEIKEFIEKEYIKKNKKPISDSVMKTCLGVIFLNKPPQNMRLPKPSERNRYHPSITPAIVNMNELSRSFKEKFDKGEFETAPNIQAIKDKAYEEQVLPKRMINQLGSFMLPKFVIES